MRDTIVLFDVDNTLLYSGGAGSLAMRRAFHELYGIEDGFRHVEYSGRTDWAILHAAMREHNIARDGDDGFRQEMTRFQETYYRLLEGTLHEVTSGRTMPGVAELLAALSERDGVRQGLATGNFRIAAFMKLRHFELDGHLAEGGFGEDAEERGEMVGVAIERLADGSKPDAASIWVVGDTPLDVAAARSNGVRALSVATGSSSVEELRDAGADVAVADLSGTESVLATLLG
ncbi:MAG: haloacid dehalogenase-like hydrolase [Chloroflexi bacterium]|nr:haloacid dehalogenase-like hydrolase [Chloroflexota bacterium]